MLADLAAAVKRQLETPLEDAGKADPRTVRQMLKEVEAVTRSRFYEDPDPIASPVEMFRMPARKPGGEPFIALSVREKLQVLGDYTHWQAYEKRGISFEQMDRVFYNVIDGKPRDKWLEGTGLHVDTPGKKAGIRGTLRAQLDAPAKPREAPRQKKPEKKGLHH
jgi:hypothetical protein